MDTGQVLSLPRRRAIHISSGSSVREASGPKRDPYARELAPSAAFPNCNSLIRSATAYPWHDSAFVTPDFSNMIIYQLHIGTYAPSARGIASTFLDVIGKIPYLVALGANVLQPLPVDEMETDPSMGYNGADLFSPDFPYVVTDPAALNGYLATINGLLDGQRLFAPWPPGYYSRPGSVESAGRSVPCLRHCGRVRRGL